MNRLVRPLALFLGLALLMGSSLALVSWAQEPEDSEPAGTDSAALEDRGKSKDIFSETQKFTEIYQYIRKMYFRPVDEKVLVNGAIEGLLQMVDRNDTFMPDPKDILGTDDESVAAHTHGLGLILGFANLQSYGASVPVVMAVEPGSPAAAAGVQAESILWQVGDRAVVGGEILAKNLYDLLDRPAGDKKVDLVLYNHTDGRKEVSLTPANFPIDSKIEVETLASGVLQFKFPAFTTAQLPEELAKLLHEHGKSLEHGLILDLRESCVGDPKLGYEMADLFIRDGAVLGRILVQREEKKLLPKRGLRGEELLFRAEDGVALLDFPLVVLVDFTTAGPGEILAGALKHAGRARVVGEKTFGYAALRQTFPFEQGVQITLTTGLYSTGQDKVFMGEGLEPDVKMNDKEDNDILAQAVETENASEEGDVPQDAAATPVPAESKDPKAPAEDLYLQSAEKEIQKIADPASVPVGSDTSKPVKPQGKEDKPAKDVG